ncbi:MAG: putative membrane-bound dehydrogenase-like protein, partial [Verrucomicrobiales bacterium]
QSPQIFTPVAMDIDAKGRIWATEGIDYNVGRRISNGQSIIVLEDTDLDGKCDSSHVFVSEPNMRPAPMGIAVFDNRIVVSATPDIIVYTDVDRNAVFDPKIDKREVFLTGFEGGNHDHTLHAVVGAPSGQWYFSFGNKGADVNTKDGRHFLAGCYYGGVNHIGKPSSDGHVYIGGVAMRINPDGTGLSAIGHNMRNSHDLFVSSFGDVFQSDNDDPAHCRASWLMEYGNMGYADLRDGSRSWEEVSKPWDEPQGFHRDLRASRAHWRENYPGSTPPGTVYGAGSPLGNVLIEGDELGKEFRGLYLHCDMVRKEVMGYYPEMADAQYEMGSHHAFVGLKPESKGEHFLPTDVILGLDGAIYVSDFYNDTSRRTNQISGTIYRISRKDEAKVTLPKIDFGTTEGLVAALKSPAVNVRSEAAARLAESGPAGARDFVERLAAENDPSYLARSIWVLAQVGAIDGGYTGAAAVEKFLRSPQPWQRMVAYRALRLADPDGLLDRAKALASDTSPAIRREIALSLRDVPLEKSREILKQLIGGYDGKNRWYLEALGAAVAKQEIAVYNEIIRPELAKTPFAKWDDRAKNLAWRFFTPEAVADLDQVIRAQKPGVAEFRHLAMAFASFRENGDRADRREKLTALAKLPEFAGEDYQITVDEIIARDLNELEGESLTQSFEIPKSFGEKTEVSDIKTIVALKGDAARGKLRAQTCLVCHKIEGPGVQFGPDLSEWGKHRTITQIVTDIVDPSAHLAQGYDNPVRLRKGKHVAEGLMSNYSWHAGSLKIKLFGGNVKKILFRDHGVKVETLTGQSLMPPASEMGLDDQDVRDVAEYLKGLGDDTKKMRPPEGTAPGWMTLTGEDFVNVNCHEDTWRWEGGHAFCNGKPTGVIRYKEPVANFEFLCEWMHKKKGGNSGVFVWATPESIAKLAGGQGSLPHGIEVQVLDLGYAEVYTAQYKKPADWFTSHGDVFPVGPVKMTPFPPVAPNGRRSFPSKETTKGINQWNHYYVRAVNGEVRLWVNGEEVSGGSGISPAMGFLCLESEGAPIEFRNLRLRKLPSPPIPEIDLEKLTPKPAEKVTLKGHPALGVWHYGEHSREVTEDGFCLLRMGDELIWKRRCISKSADGFVLDGNLGHQLVGEVLKIEGRYEAKRK